MGGRGRAGLPEGPGGSAKAGQREEVWKRGDAGSEGPGGSAEAGQREEVRKRGDTGSDGPRRERRSEDSGRMADREQRRERQDSGLKPGST